MTPNIQFQPSAEREGMALPRPSAVEVVPVKSRREREMFLRLPWRLYANFPGWVPNLLLLQRQAISEKNPFFEHGEAQLFLATRDGEPVGRVSAQIDHRYNRQHEAHTGFFGFFETVDDPTIAKTLLLAAEDWLKQRGMDTILGPCNFGMHEELGLMIEGFEEPAMVLMLQTLPYYAGLVEGAGYIKAQDLLAYRWEMAEPPARIKEAVERTRAVPGLKLRTIDVHRLRREVDTLLDVYLDAFADGWGYVPVSRREALRLAEYLRWFGDPHLAIIAELDKEPIGMVIAIPNLYEAIRDFHGFLDPIKVLRLIWRLKVSGLDSGRIILFGVRKRFRRRRALFGLPFVLLSELHEAARSRHYKWCEESWVVETNVSMKALLPYWDASVYKRYRLYQKSLGA